MQQQEQLRIETILCFVVGEQIQVQTFVVIAVGAKRTDTC